MKYNLQRYVDGYELDYEIALLELQEGKKHSHWMWYIFPQLKGLGESQISNYYGLDSIEEAQEFLKNDYLRNSFLTLINVLLDLDIYDPEIIFGYPDYLKLQSCMTIFHLAKPEEKIFKEVLNKYYYGELDKNTLKLTKYKDINC